jgi:hypothetical protein
VVSIPFILAPLFLLMKVSKVLAFLWSSWSSKASHKGVFHRSFLDYPISVLGFWWGRDQPDFLKVHWFKF